MASLGKDLATIRKKKDLSIEDVQQATKIPAHILNSIEDDSIFEQLENNTTYTRSYVRSYARSLGIKEDDIVNALNQLEQGAYDGSLAQQEEPEPEPEEIEPEEDKDKEKEKDKQKKKSGKPKSPKKEKKKAPTPKKEEKKQPKPPASPAPKRKITAKDWDWVRVGEKAKTSSSKVSRRNIILLILLLIILLVVGYFVYRYYYENDNASANSGQTASSAALEKTGVPSDSLRQALTKNDNQPVMTAENGNLPDTLSVSVYAANGQLEPVHVYTDILAKKNSKTWTDNPYWIQQGDTLRFNFVNTMRVRAENQYDRMKLLFNGHVIPNFYKNYYSNASGFIELRRTIFAKHPDWLAPPQ